MKAEIFGVTVESSDGETLDSGFEVEPFWDGAIFSFEKYEYYPTPWHRMNAVVEKLGGKMLSPAPKLEARPGAVY